MNKVELSEEISKKIGLVKKDVEKVIDTMLDIVTDKLQNGEEVTLTGFGAFSARSRKGRIGVNPRDPKQQITIPSVVVPKFKAGKNLKEALKGKKVAAPVMAEPVAEEEPAVEPSQE